MDVKICRTKSFFKILVTILFNPPKLNHSCDSDLEKKETEIMYQKYINKHLEYYLQKTDKFAQSHFVQVP